MAFKNVIKAIPLTSVASASIPMGYGAINSSGLPNSCFCLKIINNSDADVTVSYNGSTDNDFVPKGTIAPLPPLYTAQTGTLGAMFPQGLIVYIKGTAGMSGSVYLAGYYQPVGVGD